MTFDLEEIYLRNPKSNHVVSLTFSIDNAERMV